MTAFCGHGDLSALPTTPTKPHNRSGSLGPLASTRVHEHRPSLNNTRDSDLLLLEDFNRCAAVSSVLGDSNNTQGKAPTRELDCSRCDMTELYKVRGERFS